MMIDYCSPAVTQAVIQASSVRHLVRQIRNIDFSQRKREAFSRRRIWRAFLEKRTDTTMDKRSNTSGMFKLVEELWVDTSATQRNARMNSETFDKILTAIGTVIRLRRPFLKWARLFCGITADQKTIINYQARGQTGNYHWLPWTIWTSSRWMIVDDSRWYAL